MMPECLLVAQQHWRTADLSEHNIEVAVAVDVRISRATADDRLKQLAAGPFRGHGDELHAAAATTVPKELGGLPVGLLWRESLDIRIKMPIGRQHIGASVQIVIKEEQSEFDQLLAGGPQSRGHGFVGEVERIV